MKVFVVAKYDVESYEILHICKNRKLAEKLILDERKKLLKSWRDQIKACANGPTRKMYEEMIDNLTESDNWKDWSNYPHSNLCIQKYELRMDEGEK